MSTLESQLSAQLVASLATDILAPLPPILGLIQATQFVDGVTPKGKTRITLNWTAPTKNEFIGGELFKHPDNTADVAGGAAGTAHETQFDPIVAGSFNVFERTAASGNNSSLTASVVHGQRVITISTPVPADIVANAYLVIDDAVTGKEEYVQVKSVNPATGQVTLVDGLFFGHTSGANVKAVTLAAKTLTTHYTLDLSFGVLTEAAGGFTAGNRIVIRYQTTTQDLDHYELYRVPGNAIVSVPTKANVLAATGVVTVNNAIASAATSFQDQSLIDADNGKDHSYYLFSVDTQGNASNLTTEVMTQNLHLAYIETVSTVPQNLSSAVSQNQVLVSWDAISDPNANGYNIYRSPGSTFNPATALKVNSALLPKGTGRVTFDDSANNVTNRVSNAVAPFPQNGQTFTYKLETEDTVTFWSSGTTNIPSASATASKTAGVGDGTGGR